jgi:hypothetical protein
MALHGYRPAGGQPVTRTKTGTAVASPRAKAIIIRGRMVFEADMGGIQSDSWFMPPYVTWLLNRA